MKIDTKLLRKLASAKPPAKPTEYRDAAQGLLLRHQPSGYLGLYAVAGRGKRMRLCNARDILDVMNPATLRQCQVQARQYAGKAASGELVGKEPVSTVPTLEQYLMGRGAERGFSEAVRADETVRLCVSFSGLLARRLDEIVPLDLARWAKAKVASGAKAGTLVRDARMLSSALARAVEWGLIASNPLAGQIKRRQGRFRIADITLEPLEDRVRYLTDDEEGRLRAAVALRDDHMAASVIVSLLTGLRQGELFALTWRDVDFDSRTITVRAASAKSAKVRHVPMNAEVIELLSARRANDLDGLVFAHKGHAIASPKTAWGTLMRTAKIDDFRWHDLRHSFASRLVMRGVDLYTVKELLGHSTITVTEKYAHLQPQRHHDAVAVL